MSRLGSLEGRHLPGDYVLGELLGRGGMGSVYEGTHLPSRRAIAIKVLAPNLARHPGHLERFRREAETTSRLGHANIVQVEHFGHEGAEVAFYVMERLDGAPMSTLLKREGRVPLGRAVDLVCQTLAGLSAAHHAKVIHRDLKPANLFLTEGPHGEDRLKIVDFGLAKLLSSDATKLTVTGSVVGTPHYLSPEQALGRRVTARSDVFACGVILYELLAGRRPFDGADVGTLMKDILRADPERLDQVAPEVPREVADAVHRALARRPVDRFSSAESMRRALLDAIGLGPTKSVIPIPGRRLAIVAGVLGIAAIFGIVVAVAVDLALNHFVSEGPQIAAAPMNEPSATVTPAPVSPRPVHGAVPAPLGIAACDRAAELACTCASPGGPAACERAKTMLDSYREIYRREPSALPRIAAGCLSFEATLGPGCRP